MFRRPRVQFKPKIQTPIDRKSPQTEKNVSDSSPAIREVTEPSVTPSYAAENTTIIIQETDHSVLRQNDDSVISSVTLQSECVENLDPSSFPLNGLHEDSVHSNDSLTTHDVLIDTTDVFTIPHTILSLPQTETRAAPTIVTENRRVVTLKPKETAAALTVTASGDFNLQADSSVRSSDSREKRPPARKPKICLSSNRIRLPVDKSKITMMDLLSYNPPMTEEQKERRRKADEEAELQSQRSSSPSKTSIAQASHVSESSDSSAPGTKSASAGPRVKIGANGEIVIDEESLVVSKKKEEVADTVYEGSDQAESQVTYASFRNKNAYSSKRCRWSDEETVKFYKALSAVGTDFSLMSQVFFRSSRSRLDLRNKFKKEEKINQHLIDRALDSTDLSLLDQVNLMSDEEDMELKNQQPIPEPVSQVVIEDSPLFESDQNNNDPNVPNGSGQRRRRLEPDDGDDSYEPRRGRKSAARPTEESQITTRRSMRTKR